MSELSTELILIGGALIVTSYFAFIETLFTGLRVYQVKELEHEVKGYSAFFSLWKNAPHRILTLILVASNFASNLCSVLFSRLVESHFGGFGLALGVALSTIILLLFGDIIPKTYAKTQGGNLFKRSLGFLNGLMRIFSPLITILLKVAEMVLGWLGIKNFGKGVSGEVSEREIEFLIGYGDEKGIIESEKSEMLQNVFGLGQTTVEEIMVPRTDIVSMDASVSFDQAKRILRQHKYSRLPVYKGKEDNIVGMVYHKDIFAKFGDEASKTIDNLLRPVVFVPESKKINQLLQEFLKDRMHLGIVIDEHGAISGMVTLEDILEEIVGEIRDEHEKERPGVVSLKNGGWLVIGGLPLEDLEDLLGVECESEGAITLAGFLVEQFERLPDIGAKLTYKGCHFVVKEATPKRILQVRIEKKI